MEPVSPEARGDENHRRDDAAELLRLLSQERRWSPAPSACSRRIHRRPRSRSPTRRTWRRTAGARGSGRARTSRVLVRSWAAPRDRRDRRRSAVAALTVAAFVAVARRDAAAAARARAAAAALKQHAAAAERARSARTRRGRAPRYGAPMSPTSLIALLRETPAPAPRSPRRRSSRCRPRRCRAAAAATRAAATSPAMP